MIPERDMTKRVRFSRNRSCFLLGASWSHHHTFPNRVTHIYLGWWVLTFTKVQEADRG